MEMCVWKLRPEKISFARPEIFDWDSRTESVLCFTLRISAKKDLLESIRLQHIEFARLFTQVAGSRQLISIGIE
jgi:hypothetical protein